MKKKLLITMGCSFTEGVGCWDMSVTPNSARQDGDEWSILLNHPKNKLKFHRDGWPNRVGKKLGFDKVINIAKGGGSTSGQVKKFIKTIVPMDFSEYDVFILFQLPNPNRFSFYSHRVVEDLTPHHPNLLYEGYVKFIESDYDLFLEQIFYIDVMGELCKSKKFDFRTISLLTGNDIDYRFYRDNLNNKKETPRMVLTLKESLSPICGHPDEVGYEILSDSIVKYLKSEFKDFQNVLSKEEIEWEYL